MNPPNKALKNLENQLNRDKNLRAEFLKDPVKILKQEGLEVTPEMAKSVKAQFADMQLPKSQALGLKIKIGIGIRPPQIGIVIKF